MKLAIFPPASIQFLSFNEISSPFQDDPIFSPIMNPDETLPVTDPAPESKPADTDDDFDEPLGERQPDANDAIVCKGGCQ